MLETRVLSLRVLTNDGKVDVLVTSGPATGQVLDDGSRCVDVEVFTKEHVQGAVSQSRHGSVQDTCKRQLGLEQRMRMSNNRVLLRTLQGNLVSPDGIHGLLQQNLVLLGVATQVELLPLNGHLCCLEDCLHGSGHFQPNTVTGDEGDGVLATVDCARFEILWEKE